MMLGAKRENRVVGYEKRVMTFDRYCAGWCDPGGCTSKHGGRCGSGERIREHEYQGLRQNRSHRVRMKSSLMTGMEKLKTRKRVEKGGTFESAAALSEKVKYRAQSKSRRRRRLFQ